MFSDVSFTQHIKAPSYKVNLYRDSWLIPVLFLSGKDLSSKGDHKFIPKKYFLRASCIIGYGNMDVNKDNKKPLKLLGREIAKVMFKDMHFMPEARSK